MKDSIRIRVPATTANLGPGFDVLGLALGLHNFVEIEEAEGDGVEIEVTGSETEGVPSDERSYVYRALRRVFDMFGEEPSGLRIKVENNIPVARGLGSSASAILAGLVGANHLLGGRLSESEMLDLAAELEGHCDNIAAALFGGFVVSSFHDGHVEWIKIPPPKGLRAVVAIPDFELPTEKARKALPERYSREDVIYNLSHVSILIAALTSGDFGKMRYAMDDRIHQPYRERFIPGIRDVFRAALDAGALGVCISGAGPSLIAFACENLEPIARGMEEAWQGHGVVSRALGLDIDGEGTVLERAPDGTDL